MYSRDFVVLFIASLYRAHRKAMLTLSLQLYNQVWNAYGTKSFAKYERDMYSKDFVVLFIASLYRAHRKAMLTLSLQSYSQVWNAYGTERFAKYERDMYDKDFIVLFIASLYVHTEKLCWRFLYNHTTRYETLIARRSLLIMYLLCNTKSECILHNSVMTNNRQAMLLQG